MNKSVIEWLDCTVQKYGNKKAFLMKNDITFSKFNEYTKSVGTYIHALLPQQTPVLVMCGIRRYRVYDSGSANRTNKDESIETDGLKLFTNRNKVKFNDNEIKLTGKEYEILKLLMKNPDRIYTIEMIYEMVWDEAFTYNAKNTVMVHIKNLRE